MTTTTRITKTMTMAFMMTMTTINNGIDDYDDDNGIDDVDDDDKDDDDQKE